MNKKFVLLLLTSFLTFALFAEDNQARKNSEKYLTALKKRPSTGYLFDKFYSTWQDHSTINELIKKLSKSYEEEGNINDLILQGFLYEREGNNVEALSIYEKVITLDKKLFDIYYYKSKLEFASFNLDQAIKTLNEALTLKPSEKIKINIYKLLGKVYIRNDQEKEGLEIWNKLLEIYEDEDLYEEIIELQVEEGLLNEALKSCKNLIEKTKNKFKEINLTLRIGDIYKLKDDKAEALKTYSKALNMTGSNSWIEKEIIAQIEHIFRGEDDITGLLKYYEKLLDGNDKRIYILKRYASILDENDRTEDALKILKNVMTQTPLDKSNKESYADLLIDAKKNDEALKFFIELEKLYPDDIELLIKKADILYKLKKKAEVVANLKRFIELSNSEFTYIRVGRIFKNYDYTQALTSIYEEMILKYPKSSNAKEIYAFHLWNIDEKKKAIDTYKNLAKEDNFDLLIRIVRSLKEFGEIKIALEILEEQKSKYDDNFRFNEEINILYSVLKKYDKALEAAFKLCDIAENENENMRGIVAVYHSAQKIKKMDKIIEELETETELSENRICLLSYLYEKKDDEKDLLIINQYLAKYPNSITLLNRKIKLHKNKNELKEATIILEKLLSFNPKNKTNLLKQLVEINQKQNENDIAIKWIKEWRKISPNTTVTYILESKIYQIKNEEKTALDILLKAKFKFPDNDEIFSSLIQHYLRYQKYKEATNLKWRELSKIEELSKKMSIVKNLVQYAQYSNSIDSLRQRFENRMNSNKKSVFPLLALAEINRHTGNYGQRRAYLIKASEMKNNDIPLLLELAKTEEEEGDYFKALATLKKAETIDKSDNIQKRIAEFYLRQGEDEKGFQILFKIAGGIDMTAEKAEEITKKLLTSQQFKKVISFLDRFNHKFKDNYRLEYLYAVALFNTQEFDKAISKFLSLLEIKKEINISNNMLAVASFNASYRNSLMQQVGFTEEAVKLMEYMNLKYQINSYSNNNRSYGRGGANSNPIIMPKNLENLKDFVIAHLATIMTFQNNSSLESIITKLSDKNIEYAELKLLLLCEQNIQLKYIKNKNSKSKNIYDYFYEKNPDNKTITALWLKNSGQTNITKEGFLLKFNYCKDKYPKFAINIFITAIHKKIDLDEKIINEAFTLIEQVKSDNSANKIYIASIYTSLLSLKNISDELKSKISNKYEQIINDKENKTIVYQYFNFVAKYLIKNGKYDRLIEMLENYSKDNNKNNNISFYPPGHYYGGRHGNQIFKALENPIRSIKGLPFNLIMFLSAQNHYYGRGEETLIDKNKLWEATSKSSSNILKLVVANYCENKENAENAILEMLKDEKIDNSHLLFAAYNRTLNDDFLGAVELINKALKKTTDKNELKSLNSSVLFYLSLVEDTSKCKEFAKLAGSRLMKMNLIRENQIKLAEFLEIFELKELIAKIDVKLAETATTTTVNRPSRSSFGRSQRRAVSPREKINKLFYENKTDAAITLAVREYRKKLKSHIRSFNASNNSYNNNYIYEINSILDIVKNKDKSNEFLKKLNAITGEITLGNILDLGYYYEYSKQNKKALKEYEKAYEKSPEYRFVNFKLSILLLNRDEKQAIEHFKKCFFRNSEMLIQQLGVFQQQTRKFDEKLKYIKLSLIAIKESKSFNAQQSYFYNLFNSFTDNFYDNNQNIISILKLSDEKFQQFDEKTKEQLKEREKLFIELTNVCMQKGVVAKQAFALQYTFKKKFKTIDDELFQNAIIAVEKLDSNYQQAYYHNNNRANAPEIEAFIARYAYKNNKLEQLKNLRETLAGNQNYLQYFKNIDRLYNADEKGFIEIIKTNTKDILVAAIAVINIKKLNIDISENLFKWKASNQNYHNQAHSLFSMWFKSLVERSKEKEFILFSEKMLNDLLKDRIGKKESKTNLMVMGIVINGRPISQSIQNTINTLMNISPKYAFVFCEILKKEKYNSALKTLSNSEHIYNNMNSKLSQLFQDNGIKENIDLLNDISCLGDFKDFPVLDTDNSNQSFLSGILYKIKNGGNGKSDQREKNKKEIKEKLKMIDTFGSNFILTLAENDSQAAIFSFLDKYITDITACENTQIKEFSKMLGKIIKNQSIHKDEITGEFYKLYNDALAVDANALFEEFMKKKMTSQSYYNDIREGASLAKQLFKKEPEKADKLIENMLVKLKRIQLRMPNHFSQNNSIYNQLFNEFRKNSRENIDANILLIKLVNRHPQLKSDSNYRELYNNLHYCFRKDIRKLTDKKVSKINAFCETIKKYDIKLTDIKFLSSLPIIYNTADNLYDDAGKALNILENEKEPSPFIKEAKIILAMVAHKRNNKYKFDEIKTIQFYTSIINNEKYSISERLNYLSSSLYIFKNFHLYELATHAIKLYGKRKISRTVESQYNNMLKYALEMLFEIEINSKDKGFILPIVKECWQNFKRKYYQDILKGSYSNETLNYFNLFMKLSDENELDDFMKDEIWKTLSTNPKVITGLIKNKKSKLLREFIANSWSELGNLRQYSSSNALTQEEVENADKIIEEFKDNDLKFYTKIALAYHYKFKPNSTKTNRSSQDIKILAKELLKMEFANPAIRRKCIIELMYYASTELKDCYDELYKDAKVADIMSSKNSQFRSGYRQYLIELLLNNKGDLFFVKLEEIFQLAKFSNNKSSYAKYGYRDILNEVFSKINNSKKHLDIDFEKFLTVLDSVNEIGIKIGDIDSFFIMCSGVVFATKDEKEQIKWTNQFLEKSFRNVSKYHIEKIYKTFKQIKESKENYIEVSIKYLDSEMTKKICKANTQDLESRKNNLINNVSRYIKNGDSYSLVIKMMAKQKDYTQYKIANKFKEYYDILKKDKKPIDALEKAIDVFNKACNGKCNISVSNRIPTSDFRVAENFKACIKMLESKLENGDFLTREILLHLSIYKSENAKKAVVVKDFVKDLFSNEELSDREKFDYLDCNLSKLREYNKTFQFANQILNFYIKYSESENNKIHESDIRDLLYFFIYNKDNINLKNIADKVIPLAEKYKEKASYHRIYLYTAMFYVEIENLEKAISSLDSHNIHENYYDDLVSDTIKQNYPKLSAFVITKYFNSISTNNFNYSLNDKIYQNIDKITKNINDDDIKLLAKVYIATFKSEAQKTALEGLFEEFSKHKFKNKDIRKKIILLFSQSVNFTNRLAENIMECYKDLSFDEIMGSYNKYDKVANSMVNFLINGNIKNSNFILEKIIATKHRNLESFHRNLITKIVKSLANPPSSFDIKILNDFIVKFYLNKNIEFSKESDKKKLLALLFFTQTINENVENYKVIKSKRKEFDNTKISKWNIFKLFSNYANSKDNISEKLELFSLVIDYLYNENNSSIIDFDGKEYPKNHFSHYWKDYKKESFLYEYILYTFYLNLGKEDKANQVYKELQKENESNSLWQSIDDKNRFAVFSNKITLRESLEEHFDIFLYSKPCIVKWNIKVDNKVIAKSAKTYTKSNPQIEIKFKTPEVDFDKKLILNFECYDNEELILHKSQEFTIRNKREIGVVIKNPVLKKFVQSEFQQTKDFDNILTAMQKYKGEAIIIDANPATLKEIANYADKLQEFTEGGGYLMICNVTPETIDLFNKIVGVNHLIRPFEIENVRFNNNSEADFDNNDLKLYTDERLQKYRSTKWLSESLFSYVLDSENMSGFLKFPTQKEMGKKTKERLVKFPRIDHWPANMVNGLSSHWKYGYAIILDDGHKTKWNMSFPREVIITDITIVLKTYYHNITEINLFVDSQKEPIILKLDGKQKSFSIPNIKTKNIKIDITKWDDSGKERANVIGIENIEILVKKSDNYNKKVTPLLNLGGLNLYKMNNGGIILNQLKINETEKFETHFNKKMKIFKTLLKNIGVE